MVMKKKAAAKMAEAAPAYTARSGSSRSRKTKSNGVVEALWTLFNEMSQEDQGAFVRRLLADPTWGEDLYDGFSIIEASKEPSRPLEDYVAEYMSRKTKKRAK